MTSRIFLILISLQFQSVDVDGENIMFYFGVSSYSHRIAAWPLAEALADRGHSVTFVSPYPAKVPNPKIQDYVPLSLKNWLESFNESGTFYNTRLNNRMDHEWYALLEWGSGSCEVLMGDEEFLGFIRNSRKFDLIIVDSLVNECAYGFAHFYGSKLIVYSTANAYPWFSDPFGLPEESSWVPDVPFHYPPGVDALSLYQRAVGLLNPLYFLYLREFHAFPKLEGFLRASLVPDMPPLSHIERNNVSLVFLNHHFVEDFPRPLPPNVVAIPGMHCENDDKKQEQLPKEIEDFLQNAADGFLYMSFGSYAELSLFPVEIQNVFFKAFEEIKSKNIKVIWKMNVDRPQGLSENVLTAKWLPQQAILAHPKIRGFITHGGLLGIQEAIWNAVPLITFPIFAEQDYNAEKISWRKIGVKLEISRVTLDQFQGALEEILNNDIYSKNMRRYSKLFRDRPIRSVDSALWWTEYVLRHDYDDISALRPHSVHQPWWKRRQLDVWALLLIAISLSCLVIFIISMFIIIKIWKCVTNTEESTRLMGEKKQK